MVKHIDSSAMCQNDQIIMAHQSFSDDPLNSVTAQPGVIARLSLAAILLIMAIACLTFFAPPSVSGASRLMPILSMTVLAAVAGLGMSRHYPHDRLGGCNVVTMTRGALVALLTLPLVEPGLLTHSHAAAWTVVGIATLALILDGIDGYLARKSALVSRFGARFDMEVDCLLALILSALAVQGGQGVWLLLVGSIRYIFLAAGFMLSWLQRPLPERMGRKAVCVLQIATLVIILVPVMPADIAAMLAGLTLLALLWSFGRDVIWLAARR